MSVELQARTLLKLVAEKVAQAKVHAQGFKSIHASLGERTARWAYADRGTELGHRGPSKSEAALGQWEPSVDDWCLVLSGPTGIGKTISAARYVAERGGTLLRAAEADGWGFGGGDSLRAAQGAKWLLVDDLGDEKTAVGSANLATLIAHRASTGRRLVCTTTLNPAELAAKGDHVASRLRPYFVAISDREDRRTKAPPFLRGITRQLDIVKAEAIVDAIARGFSVDREGEVALVTLAKLTGVDIGSAEFKQAMADERARFDAVTTMIEQAMTDLAFAAKDASI